MIHITKYGQEGTVVFSLRLQPTLCAILKLLESHDIPTFFLIAKNLVSLLVACKIWAQ